MIPISYGQIFSTKNEGMHLPISYRLYELRQNYQPISDQIIDVPSSYRPKISLRQNPREIIAFSSISTRTIFEFIYTSACIQLYI